MPFPGAHFPLIDSGLDTLAADLGSVAFIVVSIGGLTWFISISLYPAGSRTIVVEHIQLPPFFFGGKIYFG
jgi:hypothetical protein